MTEFMKIAMLFGMVKNTLVFRSIEKLIDFLTVIDDLKISHTFASIIYANEVRGISAKSPQKGNVYKVTYAPIESITSYTQKILNKLAKKGVIMEAKDLKVKDTFWAKRHKNSMLGINKKTGEVTYLAYFPNGKPYASKYINLATGKLLQRNDIDFTPSANKQYGSSTQTNVGIAVEEQISPRILKLSNLREFKLNGIKIRVLKP